MVASAIETPESVKYCHESVPLAVIAGMAIGAAVSSIRWRKRRCDRGELTMTPEGVDADFTVCPESGPPHLHRWQEQVVPS